MNWNLLHVSAINRHPLRDINTKDYIVLLHRSHMYSVKSTHNSTYEYNNIDTMTSETFTHSWLKLFAVSLLAVLVVMCITTSSSTFSIQRDQIPMACTNVSSAEVICTSLIRKLKFLGLHFSTPIKSLNS
jgi:hypothetical protein